jgi:hypothetical protein
VGVLPYLGIHPGRGFVWDHVSRAGGLLGGGGLGSVSNGLHVLFKRAVIISSEVSYACLPGIDTVKAPDWAVTEEARVLLHVRAFLGMFTCGVAWVSADVAVDIVGWPLTVGCRVQKDVALCTLLEGGESGGEANS